MTTPHDAPEPSAPPAGARPTIEREFLPEEEVEFVGLHAWLVRDVERARVVAGLLTMVGVAILRRLWQVGRSQAHLAVFALCAFAAAGVTLALAARLARGARSVGAVAHTTGRDISHAMAAIRSLREVFRALRAAMIAVAALLAVALLVRLTRR